MLIVGAGLSGVGAACHLQTKSPDTSFAILEAREASGGTWDLFRYPGIRSDSDMFTLGYSFRPWAAAEAIADGDQILGYIRETAREYGIERRIRYRRRVVGAAWSSPAALWTVEVEDTDTGERTQLSCSFIFACAGYYDYEQGFTPEFEGTERFGGEIVHPQHWPEDLDYSGKRVVVVGSGATAVTLVPAMAGRAAHVTMLQRSPSYVIALPTRDPFADLVRRLLPKRYAYPVARWKNVLLTQLFFRLSRRAPEFVRKLIRRGVAARLPDDYPVDTHFSPRYDPWDQRVCLDPDGDLFKAITVGDASVVTDRIESFTEGGLQLASGEELEADLVITATGLNVLAFGGIELTVDGELIDFSDTVGYKGMMLSGVPNFAISIGYTNASWTLKSDLVAHYVCRLLNHMEAHGYDTCTPQLPGPSIETMPFIDLQAGYVLRSIDQMPKQGSRAPWRLHQDYTRDVLLLKRGDLEDEGVAFSRAAATEGAAPIPA